MPKTGTCADCKGACDYRAQHCKQCQMVNHCPRLGTGIREDGLSETTQGYLCRTVSKGVQVLEHRIIMSEFIGRSLERNEHVHHKDGNRQNNDILNLELLTATEHAKHHMTSSVAKERSLLGHKARWGHEGG